MTTVTCDLCGRLIESGDPIRVEVRDGDHPHNGSVMTKTIDCCPRCIRKIKLESKQEFSDLMNVCR